MDDDAAHVGRNLLPFDGKRGRAVMPGRRGEVGQRIGEADLEKHRPQPDDSAKMVPENGRRPRVGREGHGNRAITHDVAECRHAMRDRHGRDGEPGPVHRPQRLDHTGLEKGRPRPGEREEIGPQAAGKEISLEHVEHVGRRQHFNGLPPGFVDVFQQDRQRGDVIEVFVREKHMPDAALPVEVCQKADRAGIDHDLVVNEKGNEKLGGRRRQARGKQFNPHGNASVEVPLGQVGGEIVPGGPEGGKRRPFPRENQAKPAAHPTAIDEPKPGFYTLGLRGTVRESTAHDFGFVWRRMVKLTVRERESIQEAVRRFRKLVERSGIKKEMRRREFFEKPSETRRRARLRAERRTKRNRLLGV